MQKIPLVFLSFLALLCLSLSTFADVRITQRVTTSGQKFESTKMIKGSRERTEQKMETDNPQAAAYFPQIATITQCDLKRTVRLNDRKQLYMVEPFQTAAETPAPRPAAAPSTTTVTRRGGTMTMTYIVKDTGERKTIFGMQARHLIVTQEMESSADSCNGPSKTRMEYDGWYVDFTAEFNCPNAAPQLPTRPERNKPDCIDRIVYKGGGAARLGFLLDGTMKIYGPDGSVTMTQTTETLDLSRSPLDAALFDIPATYRETSSSQDLYAISMPSMKDIMAGSDNRSTGAVPAGKTARSVGVNVGLASGIAASQAEIDQYVRSRIMSRGLRAVSGTGDYTLNIQFNKIKESTAGKIGGIFGKVTGVPGTAGKVDIDMTATLSGAGSGEAKVRNKFDGPMTDALHAAIDQALDQLLDQVD
jgi:hypothetical protein